MTRAGICGTTTEVGDGERWNLNRFFIVHQVLRSFRAEHDPDTVECCARYIMSKNSGSGEIRTDNLSIGVHVPQAP